MSFCAQCGQIEGNKEVDNALWEANFRQPQQGRRHIEPFVFTAEEWYGEDEEDHEVNVLMVDRNMVERGLCPACARPDARHFAPEAEWMTLDEAQDLADMYAEMAAERRAGC